MSCSSELSREEELSEATITDTAQDTGSLSPTLRIENLLQKCKDTLDTHLASQQIQLDTSVNEYYPLTPIESRGSECKSDSNGDNRNLDTHSWQEINQELLVRGLPTISIQNSTENGGSYLIPGACMENIEFVIAQLMQENREHKALLYTDREKSTELEYCVTAQREEIHQLQQLLSTKDKIIVQLNERCAMFSTSCDQLKGELSSPHLKEIETILEESKLSKESLLIAQQRVKRLECELIDLKGNQFETNPFLQPDTLSRTFDQEALYQLSDRQIPHLSRIETSTPSKEEDRNENYNELLQQIGSFIRLLCSELRVDTIAELYTAIRDINETKQEAESVVMPVLEECVQLMNNPSLPPKLRPESYERITLKGFVELMRVWVEEVSGISCLQEVVQQLTSYTKEACHSGKTHGLESSEDNCDEWSILEISKFIHSIFLTSRNDKLLSIDILQGLFAHFSNLFKVREPVNMLTLMSDIQCRFEEMENVLRACKTAIGLKENSSNSSLINSLQNLSLASRESIMPISTYDHIELMERVKFYQQFFFHFEWIISKLFKLLNIDKLSDVIPTVEHLTQQLV